MKDFEIEWSLCSPDVILCDWLGSEHHLTDFLPHLFDFHLDTTPVCHDTKPIYVFTSFCQVTSKMHESPIATASDGRWWWWWWWLFPHMWILGERFNESFPTCTCQHVHTNSTLVGQDLSIVAQQTETTVDRCLFHYAFVFLLYPPPSRYRYGGILESLCLSVRPSVHL